LILKDPYLRDNAINIKSAPGTAREISVSNFMQKIKILLQQSFIAAKEVIPYLCLQILCDEGVLHILIGLE
jgi:hypothetical protein